MRLIIIVQYFGCNMASDAVVGLIACFISSIGYGVMFVPIKKFDSADGVTVQWVMGSAIFCVGLIVQVFEGFPTFYPLAMLSGTIWAFGNIMAVPIIRTIGMGMGMLIWSASSLVIGWASGRFGWFGQIPKVPHSNVLNYAGMVLAFISGVIFVFVKSENSSSANALTDSESDEERLVPHMEGEDDLIADVVTINDQLPTATAVKNRSAENDILDRLPVRHKRIFGISLSMLAGLFYGSTFAPVIFIQDHRNSTDYPQYQNASERGLPYVFAAYCGAYTTTTVFMIIYTLVKCNRPIVNPQIIMPSLMTGLSWAIGQSAFFVANEKLSEAISFPIITRLPGVIAALLGIFVYREIKGRRNLIVLAVATAITIVGGVLSGLSAVKL